MSFSKRTYTSGQTAITADNLNAIQDELIDLKNGGLDNYLDNYLKNRCKYYSVSDNISTSTTGYTNGSPLTIVDPGLYLVIVFSDLTYSSNSPVIVKPAAISGATELLSHYSRGTGDNGGGVFSIGIYDCEANAQIRSNTYVYDARSGGYIRMTVFAIRLNWTTRKEVKICLIQLY